MRLHELHSRLNIVADDILKVSGAPFASVMRFFRISPRVACQTKCAAAVFGAIIALSSCGSSASKKSSQSEGTGRLRPLNVVVVTMDTLRPDHLHCYGYDKIQTPNLDGLAEAGVLFEQAVTPTPLTPPS